MKSSGAAPGHGLCGDVANHVYLPPFHHDVEPAVSPTIVQANACTVKMVAPSRRQIVFVGAFRARMPATPASFLHMGYAILYAEMRIPTQT
jgi:hypothetical protein